jgi:CelD/BcsL family acetyltransferase involved in cellulose biosynthesis
VRADLLPVSTLSPAEIDDWVCLASRALSPNPFAEPDFVVPAMRGLGAGDVCMLVVREGDEWLAGLPVLPVRSWRSVPGRCLAAWRHPYCFLGMPLVHGDAPEAALALLIERGLDESPSLALDWIDADGPLATALMAALASPGRAVVLEQFERAALRRRPTADYLEQTMRPHHRRELRRTFRRLEDQLGELTLHDLSGDASAYQTFLELERSGWKGTAGTAMACDDNHAEFFRELCTRFASRGRLELWSLAAEDRTIAMKCNLVAGEVTFCFKIAYDETLGKLSPGIHLEAAYIDRFHASRAVWSDSCADPDNAMINRLWSDRRQLRSVVSTRRSTSGALPYAKWRAAARALPLRRKITMRRQGASAD